MDPATVNAIVRWEWQAMRTNPRDVQNPPADEQPWPACPDEPRACGPLPYLQPREVAGEA